MELTMATTKLFLFVSLHKHYIQSKVMQSRCSVRVLPYYCDVMYVFVGEIGLGGSAKVTNWSEHSIALLHVIVVLSVCFFFSVSKHNQQNYIISGGCNEWCVPLTQAGSWNWEWRHTRVDCVQVLARLETVSYCLLIYSYKLLHSIKMYA